MKKSNKIPKDIAKSVDDFAILRDKIKALTSQLQLHKDTIRAYMHETGQSVCEIDDQVVTLTIQEREYFDLTTAKRVLHKNALAPFLTMKEAEIFNVRAASKKA
jgi:hypothetical protein